MKLWKLKGVPLGRDSFTKTWRIMKLVVIFLMGACLSAAANGFAQKVSITEKNIPLEKAFSLIRKQTGYTFLYTETQLQSFKPVSLQLKEASLELALQHCFAKCIHRPPATHAAPELAPGVSCMVMAPGELMLYTPSK